jgi:hypothetical protein
MRFCSPQRKFDVARLLATSKILAIPNRRKELLPEGLLTLRKTKTATSTAQIGHSAELPASQAGTVPTAPNKGNRRSQIDWLFQTTENTR